MSADSALGAPAVHEVPLEPAAEAVVFCGVDKPFERVAVPDVLLREGELLAQIELATVCGSDLRTVAGERLAQVPLVLGHEQVGRVVAFGPGSPARASDGSELRIGDRIVWAVAIDCGACRMCRRGIPNKCEQLHKYGHERMRRGWELSGGVATHTHLQPRTTIVRVPEHLPAQVLAPASCATATIMAAVEAAEEIRPLRGEIVVVSGCGMLGLTAIAAARGAGATVVAVDVDSSRRELARRFGAEAAASPGVRAVRSAIADAAARRPDWGGSGRVGFGVAFELSGAEGSVQTLLECSDVGAAIVLAGSVFPAPSVPLSAELVVRGLLTIRGVHNYRPEHLERAVRFLQAADASLFAQLVADIVPFAHAEFALTTHAVRGTRVGVRPDWPQMQP